MMRDPETVVRAGRPQSRVRYKVVGMLYALAMITYIDRVCIATLAPGIMAEFSLSKVQMGYVFSAFALAYAAFEIPTARFADRIGTHAVLTRIVAWWSAFTLATGATFNFVSLLVVRFLFGVGEAGAWPCAARTFARWIPKRERGTLHSFFFGSALLAGGLTPMVISFLLHFLSWRQIFFAFGGVGLVWATVWHRWFRSEPSQHAAVSAEERALIEAGCEPVEGHGAGLQFWLRTLLDRNVLALSLMYFPNSFVFYFCITWLPTYLKERHHFEALSLDLFTGLPLFMSVVGVSLGGFVLDRTVARFGDRRARCGLGAAGYLVAAISLLLAPMCSSGTAAAVLIALAMAGNTFTLAAAWGACIEIGRANSGVVSATMNTAGQIGSLFCPLLVAYALKWFNSWDISLYVMSGLFFMGVVCWCIIDPRRGALVGAQSPDQSRPLSAKS